MPRAPAAAANLSPPDVVLDERANHVLLDLDFFLSEGGILKEEDFRRKIEGFDWKQFTGKTVVVPGCGPVPIPTWAYMVVATHLAQHASRILYGEEKRPIKVFTNRDRSA